MIFVISLAETFALKLDKTICPMITPTIQTPDRQYGVLTHIDDFKGFLTS